MAAPHGFVERLAEFYKTATPFVTVTMVEAVGSTPQDAGSKMIVSAAGLVTGTVGGGKIELKAIQHAQAMLAQQASEAAANEVGYSSRCNRFGVCLFAAHAERSFWLEATYDRGPCRAR